MADGDGTGQATETPEQERDRLRADIAARDAELRGYKATLDALKDREQPVETRGPEQSVDPNLGLPTGMVQALVARGYKVEDIAYNVRVMNDFLPVVAQPFVAALAAIGDRTDLAEFLAEDGASAATLTVKEEVEKLRQADMKAGRPVRSRKDYGVVVKARRTAAENTPDAFEARVKAEVEERMRRASGESATTRGAGTGSQTAGPGPAGGVVTGKSGRAITKDEFDRLPLKEKLEVLGDVAA